MKFETKIKLEDGFIKHRNYFEKGQSFIYSLKLPIQIIFYSSGTIYIYTGGWKPPFYVLIITGMVYMLAFWKWGKFLDKIGFFHRESEFANKRNPLARQIRRLFRIKENIKEDNII